MWKIEVMENLVKGEQENLAVKTCSGASLPLHQVQPSNIISFFSIEKFCEQHFFLRKLTSS